jgi:quinol monooxygenase YgiN
MPANNDEECSMAYCIAVRWTINPGEEQRVRELAESMLSPSNAEPGCQAYILHTDPSDPSALFLYEQYDDEAAFQAHCDSPHFVAIVAGQIFPLLSDRRLEIYTSV